MNPLQKKAWKDLGMCLYSALVGGVALAYLIHHANKIPFPDAPDRRMLILFGVLVVGLWVAIGPYVQKKRLLVGLDERERWIYEKAKMISDSVYGGLSVALFIGLPIWFGLDTPVPIYVPVCAFLAIAFIAEIVKPLLIIIQCKRENSERGAA